ncbi:lycopene beta-cyclase CrtY [Salinicola rhizosphaerae]|uniref:Lycopene cyclase n=1 Tax=Salinicola rhizosphaerae TaxID=1443141 RepID=A0ABQ3ECL1_9GAMM|nr:lycopene beta-cyclase CrtY [Salinicola rhizosphaerae]GHB33603.1 lycopene cyclase [Salinicola rhizosphaerae]
MQPHAIPAVPPGGWDLILVGGGLANGLIACHLRETRPELDVLVLEAGPRAGGNHTWSFHQGDLSAAQHAWLAPFVTSRWSGYDVRFPALERRLDGDYLSITSERFAAVMATTLGERLVTSCEVESLSPTAVRLASGERLTARGVIDGRGPLAPEAANPHLWTGFQAFVGQAWRLSRPHGLVRPILMDATVDQQGGYRFVYTLPLSPDRLLIEDTHYVDGPALEVVRARANITDYAAARGWQLDTLEREERGALPITLAGDFTRFWQRLDGQPTSGLRAGLFHPTTGYSLPQAAALAEHLSGLSSFEASQLFDEIRAFAAERWRAQRFYRMLDRMLFLAGKPDARWQVMQRFYRLDAALIERFYAGRSTIKDKLRILSGKPPVPVGQAMNAIMQRTSRLKALP